MHRTPTNCVTSIYRKRTFTETNIPYSSNQPAQYKYAAIRFLYNRLKTFNLHKEEYQGETDTIRDIMLNNGFPVHTHTQTPTHRTPPPLYMAKSAPPHINGPPLHTSAKRPHSLQTYSKRQTWESHCELITPSRNYSWQNIRPQKNTHDPWDTNWHARTATRRMWGKWEEILREV
jgi:hypothetical protein